MKKVFNIISFIMLLVLLTAEDCADVGSNTSDMAEQNIYNEIEENLIGSDLSLDELRVFEKRAVQKFYDLNDYLNIYSDPDLFAEFRKQARQMIANSFISEGEMHNYYKNFLLIEDSINYNLTLEKGDGAFYSKVDSVFTIKSFEQTDFLTYEGMLQFSVQSSEITLSDTISIASSKLKIEMLLQKATKDFGDSSQEVWEIKFGMLK